jgi:tetratricopeptide (TPR) repeat protein
MALAGRLVCLVFVLLINLGAGLHFASAQEAATFVGGAACASCHSTQAALWQGSHHALAMQPATAATVLGDFAGAKFDHFGVTTTFSRDGNKFMVRTQGPAATGAASGAMADFEVAYTFGVYPLQQYLIPMPGGRLQALGVAWDSRPKDQGGQRWFDLHPDQALPPGDPMHWTGRDSTWNHMCAACHSTDLGKNFDLASNTYKTTWSDVNVSCEACHGAGSRHVAWAQAHGSAAPVPPPVPPPGSPTVLTDQDRMGLVAWLKATDKGVWEMHPDTGIAQRTEKLVSAEIDTCATCHSRRKVIAEGVVPGAPLLGSALPTYLVPGAYHADGQIDGETFEYGSFVQSRMFHAGVTCSNCHEPHSLSLRAEGNSLCGQCHLPARFDTADHTHHPAGSVGAQCANCHMPTKTYMIVDARRDHAIRVPRPDLTLSIGTPNACTQCHTDKPAAWVAQAVASWYPHGRQTQPQYGTALQAGRTGSPDAEQQLDALVLDGTQPAIARGSALLLLHNALSSASGPAIAAALADPDPLVRAAVPHVLPEIPSPAMLRAMVPLLSDPIRAVRIGAARALAGSDPQRLAPSQQAALDAALAELVGAEMVDADRPETHLNLGLLDVRRRRPDEAEAEYRTALRLDPGFVPALANLADLDRMRGLDQQGAQLLRQAMALAPDNADVHHSLGLLLVRQHNYTEALDLLRQANALAPDNARYAYVYAIALNATGHAAAAKTLLAHTNEQHPADRQVLLALVTITRDGGDPAAALRYARALAALDPADTQVGAVIKDLERRTTQ